MFEDVKTREELIEKIQWSPNIQKINKLHIRRIRCPGNDEGMNTFNLLYELLILKCPYELRKLTVTKSRGIKIKQFIQYGYAWISTKNGVEVIYLGFEGAVRFLFRPTDSQDDEVRGGEAFKEFCKICKKHKVDITKYFITNGKEIKKQIPKPKIELIGKAHKEYWNVHHLDLNSSYMSGIARKYPELYPVIEEIYSLRKINEVYKAILTHTYGYMQSEWCKDGEVEYALAHLSLAAHLFNNKYIEELSKKLEDNGCLILAYNTDGIWYQGEIYHDELEGPYLGQWKNDHINCHIRFKSKGTYEYEENGEYKPVARGIRELDYIKPRSQWVWGDIYFNAAGLIHIYTWDENKGIIKNRVTEESILYKEKYENG